MDKPAHRCPPARQLQQLAESLAHRAYVLEQAQKFLPADETATRAVLTTEAETYHRAAATAREASQEVSQ